MVEAKETISVPHSSPNTAPPASVSRAAPGSKGVEPGGPEVVVDLAHEVLERVEVERAHAGQGEGGGRHVDEEIDGHAE